MILHYDVPPYKVYTKPPLGGFSLYNIRVNNIQESMPLTAVPTIAVFPEEKLTQEQKIEKWVWQLCRTLEQNYELRYPNSSDPVTFSMSGGRKYWKVNQVNGGVHAFVDKKTGEVYKPASWRSPAKYVRFDLRLIKDRTLLHDPTFTDWAGGYLYIR